MPKYKPKRENRNNKRPQVMAAAMELFIYHGLDGTSHEMIAQQAGVVKSTIGKLFGSKEELAVRCLLEFLDRFVQEVWQSSASLQTYPQQVESSARLFKKYRAEFRFFYSVMLTPAHDELIKKVYRDGFAQNTDMLERFRGQLPAEQFRDLTHSMMALHSNYVINGNEVAYDRARRTLLGRFVAEE